MLVEAPESRTLGMGILAVEACMKERQPADMISGADTDIPCKQELPCRSVLQGRGILQRCRILHP